MLLNLHSLIIISSPTFTMTSSTVTMRAMIYGRQCVEEVQVPLASLTKNHVLVQVHAVGLNPVDAKDVLGDKLPDTWTSTKQFIKSHFVEGHVLGFDFSGTVVASQQPHLFKTGDAVFGTMPPLSGSCAEYINAPVDQIAKKSKKLSYEEAAALPLVGLTALQALQPYSHSKSILIVGASGGTGHVAVSVANAMGIDAVVGVCSTSNIAFVQQQGATHVLDYTSGNVESMVRDYCEENGNFDVIMDCVTSADPRDAHYDYPRKLKPYCLQRYIRLGGQSFDWVRAGLERSFPAVCKCFGKEKLFWIRFPKSSDELRQLSEWADEGKLKPRVSRVMDFTAEQVQEAFDLLNNGGVKGKLVIRVKAEE